MYAEPELRPATERWWTGVAAHLRDRGVTDVPDALTWSEDRYRPWRSPELLFSQTCGHPLVHSVGHSVQVVATPHYEAPGCEGPRYRSFVLVRADAGERSIGELRGKRLAVNGRDSWSGYRVWGRMLPASVDVEEMFGEVVITGSHRESVRGVREDRADACAVDCVSHALLARHSPDELAGTRIVGRSPLQPALPFITAAATTEGRPRADPGGDSSRPSPIRALSEARAALAAHGRERVDRSGLPAGVRGIALGRTPRRST